ncbi:MAG TPA: NAD(P)-dependent oxidoreductase [bacterium]|nr:NAD(P)-dependent oxidoreductase [bacterium]
MARVAFFGVGLMGEPMARHLLSAGHTVVLVAHRNRDGVQRLTAAGAVEVSRAAEAVRRTEVAIMVLPTADDVEEVLFGGGQAAAELAPGYTVIDMGTSYPPHTRRLAARVAERGGRFLDAPVTGGPKGAQEGTLTIMVGGDGATLESVRPLLAAMGSSIYHFGGVGTGHTAKLVQNMIGIVTQAGIAEGFVLAAAAGLDVEQVFQMLASSMSASPALKSMVPKVFARAFDQVNFRLDLAYKDIRQATQLAREMTVPLPAANGATELLQLARALGFGAQDSTAVIRGLEAILRIEVKGGGH